MTVKTSRTAAGRNANALASSAAAFPDDAELLRRLRHGLDPGLRGSCDLRLISRTPVAHPGRGYLAELVEVSSGAGNTALFAKHGAAVTSTGSFRGGHAGGLSYEFDVQRMAYAVASRGIAMPLGRAQSRDGSMSIFASQIQGVPLAGVKQPSELAAVARWLGEFHRRWLIRAPSPSGLNRLNARFLAQWLERGLATIEAHAQHVDARAVAECYRKDIEVLLTAPPVLLHGDCYPSNVLVDDSGVWLIDWELAALGPGEVDLATLTLGWPASWVAACTAAYAEARWPAGSPPDMERRLVAARRYVLLRILSIPPRVNRLKRYLRRLNILLTLPRG